MLPLLIVIVSLFYFIYRRVAKISNVKPLPPGPKPLPIIGNLHQYPTTEQWKTYQIWHKKYGPIISLKLAGFNVILIGSHKVAHDLLVMRGRIYSSRPRMVYLNECLAKGLQPGFLPYGDLWKKIHRLETPLLNLNGLKAYRQLHELHSAQLVYGLLSYRDCKKQFTRYATSVGFKLALGGSRSPGDDDEFSELVGFTHKKVGNFQWGTILVDIFPFLNYLPESLASWKRQTDQMFNEEIRLMTKYINASSETGGWSWARELMSQNESENISRDQMCFVIGELSMATLVSTTSMLNLCATMCTIYPECMHRIQQELDSVVGTERLPAFEDEESLPYLGGFVSEVLRWRPLAPIGMVHSTSEEDEYMGYRIPKDAVVITSHYCVDRDEDVHPDPASFRPERWLENPKLPLSAFGFGRRKCPGHNFAQRSIFIALSRCLWAYDVVPAKTFDRNEELDKITQKGGAIPSLPPPTEAFFRIRGPKYQEVVEREWMGAKKDELTLLCEIGDQYSKTKISRHHPSALA